MLPTLQHIRQLLGEMTGILILATAPLYPAKGEKPTSLKGGTCYIGILEKNMETTRVCGGYVGIMENQMETTLVYTLLQTKIELL